MSPLPIAVLISGGGTTLRNLIRCRSNGQLDVEFKLVISGWTGAAGLGYANDANIPTAIVSRKKFANPAEHSERVFQLCRDQGVQLVVMGGYLDHLLIAPDFRNRVVNIHPSLIPAFSGKGFYGMNVHRAALQWGVKVSGCTVHFVDDEFDHGPIIAQQTCPVEINDSPESLQSRVFAVECELLPKVLQMIAQGRVSVAGNRVSIVGQK